MDEINWQIPKSQIFEYRPKITEYCLCIPVIDEGERIQAELKQIFQLGISSIIDVIICDGGSTDGSLSEDFLKKNGVRALLVKQETGKLSTQLRMGYAYAIKQGYKGIVTIDGNNKDNVEAIPSFIKELDDGIDFVQGSRFIPGGKGINTPLVRLLAIKLIHAPIVSILSGFWYTDTTNGYRALSKRLLLDHDLKPFRDVFQNYELLAYLSVKAPLLNYRVKEIPVTRSYPVNIEIPTKIKGLKGNWELIMVLLNLAMQKYNP